ncbi:hypothetical protein L6164_008398 [Bauhinia variegata]|uniref:Uncharacterized protein n=1 Tax=Bauhinia variegata TaxID=167791 RepID=A0ACB9PHR4_BAUVA|nr:hypothetical protein L6164_008398 [Bauhinia variegata]
MMIIESAMAIRFAAGTNVRPSTGVHYDMNGLVHVPSCRLTYTSSFDMPRGRFQKSNGSPFTRRSKLVNYRIRASAEHLGSAQDPAKQNGKPSYHPFEELTESTSENNGDARLTAEETSRTIIEVNSKGTVMFSSLINGEVQENIIWPDLPYLTDENGNIYFMVKNGEDVLQSLTSENNVVQVIVGVDTMEMISEMDLPGPSEIDFGIEELDDQDSDDLDENDEEEEDEDENDDYDSGWAAVISDEDEVDDDDSLADWAKLDTMRSSHPMYFAKKLAEIASDAPVDWMEQPPVALAIQGIIGPAFIEEHSDIQKHLSGSQSSNADISKSKENKEDLGVINGHVHNSGSSTDDASHVENFENLEIPVNETSFYKLEMTKIQLFSAHGHPTFVEVEDYMKAQSDAIAHSVSKIISRLKAGGEKTIQALKSLCWRCKGVQVEEAQIISVDSLGFDLRVCSGTQVQTLRFAFKKRATSEYSAERQLNDLLFPRIQQKVQTLNQTHQNEF